MVKSFPRKQYIQTCCDISDDGLTCISSSNGFGGNGCEVTVWDVRQGQMLHELSGHSETVNCCTMLPPAKFNGRQLAATSSNDTTVRVWDLATTGLYIEFDNIASFCYSLLVSNIWNCCYY